MNDISLHIIDVIQNSVYADATLITLLIDEDINRNVLVVEIGDNGRGMTQEQVNRLGDPFFTSRTTRKVGMGIPLFRQAAEQAGGELVVNSSVGCGCVVRAVFEHDNIDRPPLGDVANSFVLMVAANPELDFVLEYRYNGDVYIFDTREVKEVLEGLPLNDPSVIRMLTDMVRTNVEDLKADGTVD